MPARNNWFFAIPSTLLKRFATERLYKDSGISNSFPITSSSTNAIQTSLIKFHYKLGGAEEIIKKKHTVTILKGFSHFQNNTWSQIFLCAFFFTQVQIKLIEVSCFISTVIPTIETPSDWLDLTYYFMTDHPLNFTICLSMFW